MEDIQDEKLRKRYEDLVQQLGGPQGSIEVPDKKSPKSVIFKLLGL